MAASVDDRPLYSFVIPIFNEEAVLPALLSRLDELLKSLPSRPEAIFVDDGSTDRSAAILKSKAAQDPRYRYIGLSRNFGQQIAISAGMDAASGDAIIVMDGDLQDPPEAVHEMIARWQEGYKVVYARRISREGESVFKRKTSALFYKFLGSVSSVQIPSDVGDFRLIDRKVLDAFRLMPEQDRFVRGMFAWLGFRQTEVRFHRSPRAAGETKFPFRKMLRLASSGVIGFSDAPLRLAIWIGLTVSALAALYGVYVIGLWFTRSDLVEGWSSTIIVISFLCGMNMLMTGIIGLYIGRIHAEVKRRPLYIVDECVGFGEEDKPVARSSSSE